MQLPRPFRGEPLPDEVADYAALEQRWREAGRLGRHMTIARCEVMWAWLVAQVEDDYDDTIQEWQNDLGSRAVVQRAIDELPARLSEQLAERVRPLDERYLAATTPVSQQYWGDEWWARRAPARLGTKLGRTMARYL